MSALDAAQTALGFLMEDATAGKKVTTADSAAVQAVTLYAIAEELRTANLIAWSQAKSDDTETIDTIEDRLGLS